ncbi:MULTISPECIES: dihydrofolate reductase family protein [unclassified Haladaptatus]|uniref:dihydrofolate reductase family protein n=1 Tax=unclassified Haladaptatus TaxID=2622732 RepID=UPI00209C3D51|nr:MULTISPECIES: dihydrofolate reductase family protein [unclassified Haladaptatus]MCO8246571.1 dihydrofolate reductase family protein [Haladaptatus sp. AB643]MCO8256307.1 dihydrofolate reductase family protein [Haladaptatus sp. AB618]
MTNGGISESSETDTEETSGNVVAELSTSLDGFIAGPNAGIDNPLGDGGERLHEWVYELASWRELHGLDGGKTGIDDDILAESFENVGAVVMGKRMFDTGEEPWGDDPPFHVPVFVLTHDHRGTEERRGGTTFTFVTDGVGSALERARAAAGTDDVSVAGGANVVQGFLGADLLDEIRLHIVPVLLGDGVRLFDHLDFEPLELEKTRVVDSPDVTHLWYRVER